jgi:hypothetical protein
MDYKDDVYQDWHGESWINARIVHPEPTPLPHCEERKYSIFDPLYLVGFLFLWFGAIFLGAIVTWVLGLFFGYRSVSTGEESRFESSYDPETEESIYKHTMTRYVTHRNRLGVARDVRQKLPTVTVRVKGRGPYRCPTFAEAIEMAGVGPDEFDE